MAANNIRYPMLVWSDSDKTTDIYLKNSATEVRDVNGSQEAGIPVLITELSLILNIPDLIGAAETGDEQFYSFSVCEFPEDNISWNRLLSELRLELDNFLPVNGADTSVIEELHSNFKLDLAASALETVYNSVIYYLARLGHELAVSTIGISGPLAQNIRFLKLLHSSLGEHYQIVLL